MPRHNGQRRLVDAGARRQRRSDGQRTTPATSLRNRCHAQRQRLAYESARILSEQGDTEFERARRKAAARLGVTDKRCWPDNEEIHQALAQQQRIFHADAQERVLSDLRQRALTAMQTFAVFEPRLVGQALDGTASREQGVHLWLFADSAEEVVLELLNRGIPWKQRDGQFRYAGGSTQAHPVLSFVAGDVPIHLVVLPRHAIRNPPLSPISERPERGIGVTELSRMIAADYDETSTSSYGVAPRHDR